LSVFLSPSLFQYLSRSFLYVTVCHFQKIYGEKSVWLMSYRQALTPINDSQLLLKLQILDNLKLVTFHKW